MLRPHHALLEPRPSDRLRIGERVVDIPLREIAPLAGGEGMRVTLKSLGVLLSLVAHAGKPVSREALLEWVWPDTLPSDDVITQAITQLRKALGDDREHPRYIETISKQGYRLIAPVEWIVDAASEAAVIPVATLAPTTTGARAATEVAQAVLATPVETVAEAKGAPTAAPTQVGAPAVWWRRASRATWMQIGAVLLVAGFFLVGRMVEFSGRAQGATASSKPAGPMTAAAQVPFQRISSMPEPEYRPSLSPDGALLVYVRANGNGKGASLMLQTSAAVPPRGLTEPTVGHSDLMPAWSPDGRDIAFIRVSAKACRVLMMAASGGGEREIGECLGGEPHPIAWYPDGRRLVGAFKHGEAVSSASSQVKALYRLSLDDGHWKRIPYARDSADEDLSPVVSPDGRWIAFQRNVSLADVWRVPAEGGTPQRLTRLATNIYGLSWTPDSRALVFARYVRGRTVLSKLEIDSGRISDYVDAHSSLMYPSIPARGDMVAFEVEESVSRMRRVPASGEHTTIDNGESFFPSTGSNLLPSIAPDGRQAVFASDRTGDLRLWWVDREQPSSLRSIDGFVPVPRHPPQWDATSRRILAIGVGPRGDGAYEIDPVSGRMVHLPVPGATPVHLAYHPDPKRLLVVADQGAGRLGVTLYDRSVSPWRALATVADVAVSVVDRRNGRIVLASMSTPTLRATDLDLAGEHPVDSTRLQRRNRNLAATEDGVRVMDSDKDCYMQWRPVDGGRDAGAARCVGDVSWHLEGLSYHPGSGSLYVSTVDDMVADIGLMPIGALDAASAPALARR